MATIREVIDGLEVLAKYGSAQNVSAEHDIIYAGEVSPGTLTADECAAMERAGWHWDYEFDGWSRFT